MIIQDEDELITFAKKLELLKMNDINWLFYQMLPLCGFGVVVAFSKFLYLHNRLCKAAYELIKAKNINHANLFNEKNNDSLWERSLYIESAIQDYNSILDLIYVTLYFRFELFQVLDHKTVLSSDDINKLSETIKGKKLSEINDWLKRYDKTTDFSASFEQYISDTLNLRNLANDLKHRGSFVIKGLDLPRSTVVTKSINGEEINITECVTQPTIDIEAEIANLVIIHRLSFDLIQQLYKICDFHNCLHEFLQKAGLNKDYEKSFREEKT